MEESLNKYEKQIMQEVNDYFKLMSESENLQNKADAWMLITTGIKVLHEIQAVRAFLKSNAK